MFRKMSETPHVTLVGENLQELAHATLTHFFISTAVVELNPPALETLPRMNEVKPIDFMTMNLRNLDIPQPTVERELGIGKHMSTRYVDNVLLRLPAVPARSALPRFLFDIGYYQLRTTLPSLNLSPEETTTVDLLTSGYTQPYIDNTTKGLISARGHIQNITRRTGLHGAPNIILATLLSDTFGTYSQDQEQAPSPTPTPTPADLEPLRASIQFHTPLEGPSSLHFIIPPGILEL